MTEPTTIEPKPNGPLQVSGPVALTDSRGETIATDAKYWLCRCGESANKPFCDGTHRKNGFSSERLADPAASVTKAYAGKAITVHDNRSVCAHAGLCTEHSPAVFSMDGKPWINADAQAVDATIATIEKCPSGALSYSIDGVTREHAGRLPAIQVTKDGPYAVVGSPQLLGDAAPLSDEHFTLCRCGQSKNKPFCDGTHWKAGFKDEKN